MLRQLLEKDFNEIADARLNDPLEELKDLPNDPKLGLNMAEDARKVISGKLNIKDFHEKYNSSLKAEFGEYFTAEEINQGKKSGVKWGMVIDLRKCVGCDSCTVACKSRKSYTTRHFLQRRS